MTKVFTASYSGIQDGNYFLGTYNNYWYDSRNWSLGVVPGGVPFNKIPRVLFLKLFYRKKKYVTTLT